MKNRTLIFALATALLGASASALAQFTQPLTPGNLVVVQVGDGAASLTNAATGVTLVEFPTSPGGTPVQSAVSPLTVSGSASSEGQITVNDGVFAIVGYNAPAGTPSIVATTADVVNRGVLRFLPNGSFLPTVLLSDAYSANNIRSAVVDGTNLWTSGTAAALNGVRYVDLSLGSPFVSTRQFSLPTNIRVVNIYNGKLYFTTQSGNFVGVNTADGIDLPMSSTADSYSAIKLPGFQNDTINGQNLSPYDFVFVDDNTLYVACDRSLANGGGLIKYVKDSLTGDWSIAYKITEGLGSVGLRSLTYAGLDGGSPRFYAISAEPNASRLLTVVDTGVFSTFSVIQTAPANVAYRGVELVPASGSAPTVSGEIQFSGRVAGFPATVDVDFRNPATFAVVHTATNVALTPTANPEVYSYTVPSGQMPAAGNYLLSVFPAPYLRKNTGPVNTGVAQTNQDFVLAAGDINRDNQVNLDDFLVLASTYEQSPPSAPEADLTGDGVVNLDDFLILAANYETTGDQPVP